MPENSLSAQILRNIASQGILLSPKHGGAATRIVVAYSGGTDSSVLLHALAGLRETHELAITAAYYNHGWRNPPRELPMLHKTTEELGLPLVIIPADRTLPKTETAAREARYAQLCRLADDLDAHALLTAHHADDQVETILFRIIRGTGLDGLAGIQKKLILDTKRGPSIPIVRPLLDIPRQAIEQYAKDQALAYFNDPSNLQTKHHRNLIRKTILPTLQMHFPQVKNSLYKIGLIAESELHIVDEAVDELWESVYQSDEKGFYLSATVFNQLDLPYQRRILKRFLQAHRLPADFQSIEDTLGFIRGDRRHDVSVGLKSLGATEKPISEVSHAQEQHHPLHTTPDGQHSKDAASKNRVFLSLYKNRLRILNLPPAALHPYATVTSGQPQPADESVIIPIPEGRTPSLAWSPRLKTSLEISKISKETRQKLSKPAVLKASALLDPNIAYVDLNLFIDNPDRLEAPKPLELRTRRPGDRFMPMGMTAPMRLKKFLINKGVPRFERDTLPLLASGNHVLWIPGLGLSEYVKVTDKPTHRLQMSHSDTEPPPPAEPVEETPEEDITPVFPSPLSDSAADELAELSRELALNPVATLLEDAEPLDDTDDADNTNDADESDMELSDSTPGNRINAADNDSSPPN